MRWFFAVLVFSVLLAGSSQAQEPARLALLIGNQAYATKVGPLKNPLNDVTLIGASLKQLGFKVTVLKDANYKEMDIHGKSHKSHLGLPICAVKWGGQPRHDP